MSHAIGRVVPDGTRIGPDTGDPSTGPDTWEFAFTPDSTSGDEVPRFVVLHFTDLDLPGDAELQIDLGYGTGTDYDTDKFDSSTGSEAWTRVIDPRPGPITIRYVGSDPTSGGATLAEYGLGEPTTEGSPGAPRDSLTNPDFFLHTATDADPYDEPTYETRLECGGTFDWDNAAAATSSVEEAVARATCILVAVKGSRSNRKVSSCSGTLIDSDLVLTAHHCFQEDDEVDVRSASVTFDYATTASGHRPSDYAPTFHKVVRKVDFGGPGEPDWSDWSLLQIETPSTGLGIAPRSLRSAPPMGAEPVTAVHHPNGAVKKIQSGTLAGSTTRVFRGITILEVLGFDFAGGSSGSTLFDAAGDVVGGPLSRGPLEGGACHAGYCTVRSVLDGMATPEEPPSPLDVMLVLDRSGSMASIGAGGASLTKLEEAQEAASLFVQLVRSGGDDRLGMVSFSSAASSPPESPPGAVTDAKKAELVGGSFPFTGGTVGGLSTGGTTSIGDGIEEALEALSPPTGNQRTLLLLTDGLQNTDPMIDAVEGSLGDTRLCIVGFGTEDQLDGPLLTSLARDHGGIYTRAADGLRLRKFFALCFGDIFESGTLSDPDAVLDEAQGEAEPSPFEVCGEDTVTVVVGWDTPEADLEAEIRTPGGTPVTDESGEVVTERGRTWWFARIPLPVDGERDGRWTVTVRRRPTSDEFATEPKATYFLSVIADGGPELRALPSEQRVYTGDSFNPLVALHYSDGTVPHADVEVSVESPADSLGRMAAEEGLTSPRLDGDPVDAFTATLQGIAARAGGALPLRTSTETFELHDDGAHEDGAMERDGIYGNVLPDLTRYEGSYEFHAKARYGLDCDAMREARWSVHVEVGIDPDRTDVEVIDGTETPNGSRTGTVRVTPRDQHGNPLGPGRSDRFDLKGRPGTTVETVVDTGDGSYEIDVAWDPTATARPGVVATQPDRDPVHISPPSTEDPSKPKPSYMERACRALAGLLFVLLVFELVRWLRRKASGRDANDD